MDFKSCLQTSADQVEQVLDQILSEFLNETKKTNPKLTPFALELKNSSKGGKRIRGVLCKLGYQLASSKSNAKEIIKVSAALEILHTALLIHDDIMDKSPTRRNNPSLYKALGGNHKAISQAISLGDIGFYLPVKLISGSAFADEVKIKALGFLSEVIINTGWGQILDMENSKQEIEFIRTYKTAKYTIAGPLQIGAILAAADKKLINLLGQFGEKLGIAFQIQDDILDGEASQLDSQHSLALKYISQAKEIIPSITKDPNISNLLIDLGDYLVERSN